MSFSDNLKNILNDNQIKQAELCRMTGIQTSLMSDYLSGKKSPAITNAIAISKALNVSLDTLVGKIDDYNPVSSIHKKVINKINKMDYNQIKAILAFVNSLDEIETELRNNSKEDK